MTSLTRLSWQEDVLRRKPCFDSRKKRNASSVKLTKRQKWWSGKDRRKRQKWWSGKDRRKRCEKNKKRRRQGEEKKITREIWLNV